VRKSVAHLDQAKQPAWPLTSALGQKKPSMNKKRDYIVEINSRKSRLLKRSNRWDLFTKRNDPILYAFDHVDALTKLNKEKKELLKYFPIGMVACIEGYFRLAMADLIDSSDVYHGNLENIKDIKLDIKTTLSIYNKNVTLGELISHLITINNLDDINKYMSIILGEDFLKKLMLTPVDLYEGEFIELSQQAPTLYKDIKAIFTQRHIFAHELAIKEKVNAKEARILMAAATVFVYSTEVLMDSLLEQKP